MIELKKGATRWVFLIGKYAVKIPYLTSWRLFLHGLLGNMQERQWSGFHDLLCPVLLSLPGGFLVVMPRCKEVDDSTIIYNVLSECEAENLPVEAKCCSFGVLPNGRVVAVDYGS